MKTALIIVGAIALVVGVIIGGYHLNWWLAEDTTNRRTGIANDSLARQQALVDSVQDKYRTATDIDVQVTEVPDRADVLMAQREAVVDQFCDDYGQLTDRLTISDSIHEFASKECA